MELVFVETLGLCVNFLLKLIAKALVIRNPVCSQRLNFAFSVTAIVIVDFVQFLNVTVHFFFDHA